MTDSQPHGGPSGAAAQPTFFDPSFERLPASVSGDTAGPGPVLLVFDRSADRDWAADAAVALATGWHAAGRRTVLADLCLDDPFLNERIGMPNQEGVVDIFLYGASLARSARAVPGRGFYLISAGTYTPEPGAVLRNPRWDKIVGGFRDNQAALLLFAPSDAPELPALRRFVREVILLGGADGAGPVPQGGFDVRAWLAPPRGDGIGTAAAAPVRPASPADRFPEPEPVSPWNAPPGTRAEMNAAPTPSIETTGPAAVPVAEIPVPEADWERQEPAKKKRAVSPLLLILLLVALLAALLFLGPQYIPGFPDLLASGGSPRAATAVEKAPAAPAPAPVPAGPVTASGAALPYSVNVANYNTAEAAYDHLRKLSTRFRTTQFFIVPEPRQGMLFWKVMAGTAEDTVPLRSLREQLIASGDLDEQADGGTYAVIQQRPLAFEVGEYPSEEQARARVDSLANRLIPTYAQAVPYTDGSERWKVYAGAYSARDTAQSLAPMRDMLTRARIEPKLVERTGRPPASPK